MTDRFPLGVDRGAFGSDVAVRVDLDLHPAVTEDSLRYDGNHIDAVYRLADDERGGLVVRVCRSGTDRGYERAPRLDKVAVPIVGSEETDGLAALFRRCLDHGQGIKPDQPPIVICIPVACTGAAVGDVAHHRAGIAADLRSRFRRRVTRHCFPRWPPAPLTALPAGV